VTVGSVRALALAIEVVGFARRSAVGRLVGRGVAALAADTTRARWTQKSVTSADLARE